MSDIQVPPFAWNKLRQRANVFLPVLNSIRAGGDHDGFTNAELYRAGESAGVEELSQHIIGKVMDLRAVTHDTARKIIRAYTQLRADKGGSMPPLDNGHIVSAFLKIPRLKDVIQAAGLTPSDLHSLSAVSDSAILHALAGGRVTGAIAVALHSAIGTAQPQAVPMIEAFATSDPAGQRSVAKSPFSFADLTLKLPLSVPSPWE